MPKLKAAADLRRFVEDNGITIADALDAIGDYAKDLAARNAVIPACYADAGRYLRIEEAIRGAVVIARQRFGAKPEMP